MCDPEPTRRTNPLRAAPAFVTVNVVPELVIRPLDPHDDADMDGFQDVYAAAELAEDPDAALYSREDGIAMMTSGDQASLFDAFGAFVNDRMVAEAILIGSTRDNLELGQVLLWVDPDHRRRGFGTSVLDHVEEHARSRGRRILRVQIRVGEGLAGNRVDRLAAEAAPHHDGYDIRSFVGPVPGELRASYVEIRNLLGIEAPHGDLELEVGQDTVEDLDVLEREGAQAGRTSVTAVALHDTAVVAYAHASVPAAGFHHVDQYGTLVHPDHRGHRLGMAVKCAQLRLLAERFQDRRYIQTSNAEVNAHMVAINVALGFEIHQVWGEFEKRLEPADV